MLVFHVKLNLILREVKLQSTQESFYACEWTVISKWRECKQKENCKKNKVLPLYVWKSCKQCPILHSPVRNNQTGCRSVWRGCQLSSCWRCLASQHSAEQKVSWAHCYSQQFMPCQTTSLVSPVRVQRCLSAWWASVRQMPVVLPTQSSVWGNKNTG